MNRSRAMDVLRDLDPAAGAESVHSSEARRMLASAMDDRGGPTGGDPRRDRSRIPTFALVAVLALAAGFGLWRAFAPMLSNHHQVGRGPSGLASQPPAGGSTTAPTPGTGAQLYEADATVLQLGDNPARLCVGAIADSLPPQCGDVPITNWSWDGVSGERTMSNVTWGDYHVVGTFDGSSFTVTDVGPRRPSPPDTTDHFPIPCPEPPGGWVAPDPARTSRQDLEALNHAAQHEPDYAGLWIHYLVQPDDSAQVGPNDLVLSVAFTGDVDRHQAELSKLWGGPLCVARFDHTYRELLRIQNELTDRGPAEFGFQLLFADANVVTNTVEIGVVAADARLQAAVDQRYGPGTVVLQPALRPVSATGGGS
jgi:hypothetical protein